MANRPIGVFDSGIGGLTVVKEMLKFLPNEEIVYFGDTARVPYGTKSKDTVTRFAMECIRFLNKREVKMIVIACNTVSASSLPEIRKKISIPVQGVITPGARAAVAVTKTKKIGVIGTERTVSSGAYIEAIKSLDPETQIYSKACPLFVPLVEEGWLNDDVTYLAALKYLNSLKKHEIDTLVLACTHYPLLKGVLKKVMGGGVILVDSATETAKAVKQTIDSLKMQRTIETLPQHKFFVSDTPDKFVKVGEMFLGRKMDFIQKINTEEYAY